MKAPQMEPCLAPSHNHPESTETLLSPGRKDGWALVSRRKAPGNPLSGQRQGKPSPHTFILSATGSAAGTSAAWRLRDGSEKIQDTFTYGQERKKEQNSLPTLNN